MPTIPPELVLLSEGFCPRGHGPLEQVRHAGDSGLRDGCFSCGCRWELRVDGGTQFVTARSYNRLRGHTVMFHLDSDIELLVVAPYFEVMVQSVTR